MKTLFSLLIFAGLLFYSTSCHKKLYNQTGNCTAAAAGDTVIFVNDTPIPLFAPCDKELRATVTKIMDSRCPKGVNCIWAGTVNVELQLNDQAVLTLGINKQKDTVYNNRHYSFTLVDVVPYPGTSSDQPKAILRIIQNRMP